MSGVERRYKVRQLIKHKDEYSEIKDSKRAWSFLVGLGALACTLGFVNFITMPFFLALSLEVVSIRAFVETIKMVMQKIDEMTSLEIDMDKIMVELVEGFESKTEKINDRESAGRRR